jgi:hypothetical protein
MEFSDRFESTKHLLICSARPGVSKAQVLEATRATNAVLRRMPGYVEHEIAVSARDGGWVDVVHWSNRDAALTAEALYKRHPNVAAVSEVIEQRWVMVLPIPAAAARVGHAGAMHVGQPQPCERCCG